MLDTDASCRKSARLHHLIDAFIGNVAVTPFDELRRPVRRDRHGAGRARRADLVNWT
jgi:hypothetical protein